MHELQVSRNGDGAGDVRSEPEGIACGPQCSARFEAGTRVTLHATPQPGFVFAGWDASWCTDPSCHCSWLKPCELRVWGRRKLDARFVPRCDPNGWCREDPPLAIRPQFNLIRGSSENNLWFAGVYVVHWNGSRWREIGAPFLSYVTALWSGGPDDAWVVIDGFFGRRFLRWKGSETYRMAALDQANDVWGSGPDDVWAVGSGGLIGHWDGQAWTLVPSGTDQTLTSVWGHSPDDVWAGGIFGQMLHWDGRTWSAVASSASGPLRRLRSSGPLDVWAANPRHLSRWDGTAWQLVPSGPWEWIDDLWVDGPDRVWVLEREAARLWRWDGRSWTAASLGVERPAALWRSGPEMWLAGDQVVRRLSPP